MSVVRKCRLRHSHHVTVSWHLQTVGQGTLSGHLVAPGTVFAAPLKGHKSQIATRPLIRPHQSDVFGSVYDLVLSLEE
ncbi:hypothetical protein EMIT0P258_20412 [Pseudomonas sp. IT-P258]